MLAQLTFWANQEFLLVCHNIGFSKFFTPLLYIIRQVSLLAPSFPLLAGIDIKGERLPKALFILSHEEARFPIHFQETWICFHAKEPGAHPISTPDPAVDGSESYILSPAAVSPRDQAENSLHVVARDLTEIQFEDTPRQLRKSPQRCRAGDHWLFDINAVHILSQRLDVLKKNISLSVEQKKSLH